MVSPKFWREHLGGSEDALGKQLHFGGTPFTLIGVVSEDYTGLVPPLEPSFWVPTPGTDDLTPSLVVSAITQSLFSLSIATFSELKRM